MLYLMYTLVESDSSNLSRQTLCIKCPHFRSLHRSTGGAYGTGGTAEHPSSYPDCSDSSHMHIGQGWGERGVDIELYTEL